MSQMPSPRTDPLATAGLHGTPRRIGALVLRHWYLLRSSVPRMLEMAYWPTIQITTWGFITDFLARSSDLMLQSAGIFLAAVLLWDVLFRGNLGLSLGFLEEIWSRNLGHLFVSPLRAWELLSALMVVSILRTIIGVGPATLLAILFHAFNIYSLGLPLLAFFFNLLAFGWVIGIVVSGLVLRYGQGAESMAWALVFLFWPISGIYYPVDVLPEALQWIALAFPPIHVFEGMRGVVLGTGFDWGHFAASVGLNLLYLSAAMTFFLWMFRVARRQGLLLTLGE